MISIWKDLMSSGNRRRKRPESSLRVDAPRTARLACAERAVRFFPAAEPRGLTPSGKIDCSRFRPGVASSDA